MIIDKISNQLSAIMAKHVAISQYVTSLPLAARIALTILSVLPFIFAPFALRDLNKLEKRLQEWIDNL